MRKILIFLTVITLFSCEQTEEFKNTSTYIAVSANFYVVNSENEDLLNPDTSNAIDIDKIKIFHVIDGQTQLAYTQNYDNQNYFNVTKSLDERYLIEIGLNHSINEEKPITYIQWSDNINDRDTIKVLFRREGNSIIRDNIWLNGELIWKYINDTNLIDNFVFLK